MYKNKKNQVQIQPEAELHVNIIAPVREDDDDEPRPVAPSQPQKNGQDVEWKVICHSY